MNTLKKNAREAGLLYLLMAISGGFGIMYVPSTIIVAGAPDVTAANVLSNEMLFRIGIVSQLVCNVVFIYLVLSLKHLLRAVNEHYASQMVALVVVSVPIAFLNMGNQLAVLVMLKENWAGDAFNAIQLHTIMMLFLRIYENGVMIVQIFWGLWLIPFGLLVYRSRFIPAFLGVLLVIGGFGYVIASLTGLLLPSYANVMALAALPSAVAEFLIIFWLLIKGVRVRNNTGNLSTPLS